MRSSRTRIRRRLMVGLLAIGLIGVQAGSAAATGTTTLVPIGSDYQPDTLQLFAREAARRSTDAQVHILVLPITYSLSADSTTKSERKKNLTLADNRRGQVESACNAVRSESQSCFVELIPVLVRSDAEAFNPAPYFSADLDGMYVLGGDQTVAMNVVANTPLESAMTAAFEAGAVFGGNSAGAAVQSVDMINGYTGSNGPAESMRQGAVELCTPDPSSTCVRGLTFGFDDIITDQHVFEYGRTGRSLNIALQSGKPILGVDAATGAVVTNYTNLRDVTGDTAAYVLDPTTYGSTGTWGGPNATLAARHVAVHLLPPGGSGFDFTSMRPSLNGVPTARPSIAGRTYPAVTKTGSGPLFLAGGIVGDPGGPVGDAFVAAAGGANARILVIATGYAKSADAQADAKAIAAALTPDVASASWIVLDARVKAADVQAISGATGIILTAPDRALVGPALAARPDAVAAIAASWGAGGALLADNAAAAVLGSEYVAEGISADVEVSSPEDMLGVAFGRGLGWVSNLDVQPRLLPDQDWPQLFQLATRSVAAPAVGIDVGTAVRISGGSANVIGDSAAVVLDSSRASFGTGSNGALAARWLILDSFVDGQTIAP